MQKTLLIGLDGVPLDLIKQWANAGHLPNLQRLMTQGTVGTLNSTVPHTSAPAWTSFMTGKNPGKTGIYDFLYRQPNTYTFYPNNGQARHGKTVWQLLSEHDKRVVVVNVPLTYPVEKINGTLIGGWMTPYGRRDFTYPPSILDELESKFGTYPIYPSETFSEKHPEKYLTACRRLSDIRTDVALHLMEGQTWDFFMTVYFDTDRILHQLWHYLDTSHRWRAKDTHVDKSIFVRQYFEHLDKNIGRLLEQVDNDTMVMVMSDHGMGIVNNMVVLNTWLLQQNVLHLKQKAWTRIKQHLFNLGFTLRTVHIMADKLGVAKHAEYKVMYSADKFLKKIFLSFDDVDWSKSQAYSFGRSVGPIYLNVKGREPHGIIEPGAEYERVRHEIAELARNMTDPVSGLKLVREVLYREDVYHGAMAEHAPDLILQPTDEANKFYGLSDFGSNQVLQPMYRYSGMHRQHGLLIMNGTKISPQAMLNDAQIIDVAPTILHSLNVPVPTDMDGRVLLEAFTNPSEVKYHTVADETHAHHLESSYTPEEAAEIENRLRQLGYLE